VKDNNEYFRLIGVELSPYTRKLRSIFRYTRTQHVWLCRFPQFFEETKNLKPGLMPVVQYPDKSFHFDSTRIALNTENWVLKKRSIYPFDNALRFLALVIEDFADEWVSKLIFHYRFTYEKNRQFGPKWVVDDTYVNLDFSELQERHSSFLERQISRMSLVGCTPENTPIFEMHYPRLLQTFESFVQNEKFLFGTRPSIADFGIQGQLSVLAEDLTTGSQMRKEAPRTIFWLSRLEDASGVEGQWHKKNELSDCFYNLTKMISDVYFPYLNGNALAINNQCESFTVKIDGFDYSQKTFGYHLKCKKFLMEEYAKLNSREKRCVLEITEGMKFVERLNRVSF